MLLSPTKTAASKIIYALPEQNSKEYAQWRILHLVTDDLHIVKDTLYHAAKNCWHNRPDPIFLSIDQLINIINTDWANEKPGFPRPRVPNRCYQFPQSLTDGIRPKGSPAWTVHDGLNKGSPVFVYLNYLGSDDYFNAINDVVIRFAQYMEIASAQDDKLYNNLFFVVYGSKCLIPESLQHYVAHIPYPELNEADFRILLEERRCAMQEELNRKAHGGGYKVKTLPEITDRTIHWFYNNMSAMGEPRTRQLLMDACNSGQGGIVDFNNLDSMDALLANYKNSEMLKRGFLQIMPLKRSAAGQSADQIMGAEAVYRWFDRHKKAAKLDNYATKGIFLVGMPGTGKSAASRIAAQKLDMPLVKFDISTILSSYVGESEKAMKAMLEDLEKASPCVLWIDEIEKNFSGSKGGSGDGSAVMQRLIGQLLQFMQEHEKPVFLTVTANSLDPLPPELYRNDRFDSVFAFLMPDYGTCKKIMGLKLNKYLEAKGWKKEYTDKLAEKLLNICIGTEISPRFLSGADIEQYAKELYWQLLDCKSFPGDNELEEHMKKLAPEFRATASPKNSHTMRQMAKIYLGVMRDSFIVASQSDKVSNLFSADSFREDAVRFYEFDESKPAVPRCLPKIENPQIHWYDRAFYDALNKAMCEVILMEDTTFPMAREQYDKYQHSINSGKQQA